MNELEVYQPGNCLERLSGQLPGTDRMLCGNQWYAAVSRARLQLRKVRRQPGRHALGAVKHGLT